MSNSSTTIEADNHRSIDINDEPLDPRIHTELERVNAAIFEINNLEVQLDNAQKLFQITFNNCKQRLAELTKTLGRCVERARPYYDSYKQTKEAQFEAQKAAQEYQTSAELYNLANKNFKETNSSNIDDNRGQEYIDRIYFKIMQAKCDKIRCEQIHEEKSKLYQNYEQQRIKLYRSLTKSIIKSKPYFDVKLQADNELKNQKVRIEDVRNAIVKAKAAYRTALNSLESISEEIHLQRKTRIDMKLIPREPGVGAENPDTFIELQSLDITEFPKNNLSDESSDNDFSDSINSSSVNINDDDNKTNLFSNICNTKYEYNQTNDPQIHCTVNTNEHINNETPLLLNLIETHKSNS